MAALVPPSTSHQVDLLPDPALPGLSRPLAIVGPHTYAAIWPYVNRHTAARPVARELILVRDDGQLLIPSPKTDRPPSPRRRRSPIPGLDPSADFFLPSRPPVPADRLWSGLGVQRYLAGHRPDPAVVFSRLVTVLNQFIDFTGSLGPPALMAEFFAAYLLTTWFTPAFPFIGMLWLTGDTGSGKSRLLALLARLSHLGLFLPVPPPPAALRSLASLGASLAIDDAGFLGPQPNKIHWSPTSRHALLLAGRQRGALLPVTLVEPGAAGARHTRHLDISGPRLFAAVHLPHPGIARYFIVVPLARTPNAALAAADPANPADWPSGLALQSLVDDLWALALSRLPELPPHLILAAQAASSSSVQAPPSHLSLPLLGSSLQPWHALLATASWLSSAGVPGLLDRLLGLARSYTALRPAPEAADVTVLALYGLFACASATYQQNLALAQTAAIAEYERAGGIVDADEDEVDDTNVAATTNDADDAKMEKAVRNFERRLARADWAAAHPADTDPVAPAAAPFPASFTVTSAQLLQAMRGLAPDLNPDLPLANLTPSLVGRLLRQLRLSPHRTARSRVWAFTTLGLARLARAYSVRIPPHLAGHFVLPDPPVSSPAP